MERCHNETKKFLLCNDEHSTLAGLCLKRMDITTKRMASKENKKIHRHSKKKKKKKSITVAPTTNFESLISTATRSVILTCMLYAHLVNMATPGTYEK